MEEISTPDAPAAIGPYSQGVRDGETIYVSGQGPLDPATGEIVGETPAAQTAQTLENVNAILAAAGTSLDTVVKATVFLMDMSTYEAVNDVYAEHMTAPFPARSAVEVADLPAEMAVEIEVIASTVD